MANGGATSRDLTLAYYCSGHGYGHATRVSAFTRHLLSLNSRLTVYIVSSAPKHVFADSIALGALYRSANIDPVIVQPLAYRVDRAKSVKVLEGFLTAKDTKVAEEVIWLTAIRADCVLSDAAFLGCLAANEAGIPSILITNFSFDSVYSYLSTYLIDEPPKSEHPAVDGLLSPPSVKVAEELEPDFPISLAELAPLVEQIHSGYCCADLLLRLPGAIPLPSFAMQPNLPSPEWVDIEARAFKPSIIDHLTQPPSSYKLHPQIPFPDRYPPKSLARQVRAAPLLVRSPAQDIYTPEGRSRLLTFIGVPPHLHDPEKTKILIVSFGGQVFHKPHSRTPSKASTPSSIPPVFAQSPNGTSHFLPALCPETISSIANPEGHAQALEDALRDATNRQAQTEQSPPSHLRRKPSHKSPFDGRPRPVSQLRIAGAPPAAVPTSPRAASSFPAAVSAPMLTFQATPPTPIPADSFDPAGSQSQSQVDQLSHAENFAPKVELETVEEALDDAGLRILPDESWIAVVCGVSKDWAHEDGGELPENFFVAPRDVYMPDLTAVADVLLGKLGYGTVSECVDACTPFVYVPRPLFIEEHGLRLYLEHEGVGVELSRTQYEVGEWADAIQQAWDKGRDAKARKREVGETGKRKEEGREMAQYVVDWVRCWKDGVSPEKLDVMADMNRLQLGGLQSIGEAGKRLRMPN